MLRKNSHTKRISWFKPVMDDAARGAFCTVS